MAAAVASVSCCNVAWESTDVGSLRNVSLMKICHVGPFPQKDVLLYSA